MVGCGSFTKTFHGPALKRCLAENNDLELVACCARRESSAREFASAFGFARPYNDVLQMLDIEKPDAVIVAVPPEITCNSASPILERGYPTFLEKPPGLFPAELEKLIEAAKKGGAKVQVAFNRRHIPVMVEARRILDTAFADAPVARIDYDMIRYGRWDSDFSTTAIHSIDAVRFLAASPFLSASLDYQPQKQGDKETMNVTVNIVCVSGVQMRINIRPVSGRNAETATIHALGKLLTVRLPFPGNPVSDRVVEYWSESKLVSSFNDTSAEPEMWNGIYHQTAEFLDAVRTGAAMGPSLADCRQQVALMEAMRNRQQGPITFDVR
jgi:predicted dehydrogenase